MLAMLYMAANRTTSLVFINDVIANKGHRMNPESTRLYSLSRFGQMLKTDQCFMKQMDSDPK